VLRHLAFHNFWLKTFSVALATVIWLAIYRGIQNDVTPAQTIMSRLLARQLVRVPVAIIKRPGDTRLFKITPPDVVVSLTGGDLDLRRVLPSDMRVFVDVTDFPSGKNVFAAVHAEAPTGDSVQEVHPANVMVEESH
jgi:YbbR domain-containing protein